MCGTSSQPRRARVLARCCRAPAARRCCRPRRRRCVRSSRAKSRAWCRPIFLLGIIVAPTLGPTLGGWITDNYTWNWCFFINVPIGIVVGVPRHDVPARSAGHADAAPAAVDWLGIGLLIVGVGSLQYVLEEGNSKDWFSSALIIRLSIIVGRRRWSRCSGGSCRRATSIRSFNFRVLKNRDLAASIFLFIVLGFGLYGGVFLFPLFTQTLLGFTPTETGLAHDAGRSRDGACRRSSAAAC